MIWMRDTADQIHPTLNSLRRTFSQHIQHAETQQDLYQNQINWNVIGSIISLVIFIILLFATIIGIPSILLKIKRDQICPPMAYWPEFSTSTVESFPTDVSLGGGFNRLCTENALWDSRGVTVAGLPSGLPSTSLAGLQYPYDIYVYGNRTILVSDYSNDRIMKWDPNAAAGALIAGTGSSGSWSTLLTRPRALTVRADQLYVSDQENYRIQVFSLKNNLNPPEAVTLIGRYGQGSGINQINQVTNIIAPISFPSLLYMSDSKNHRILLWDSKDNTTKIVAGRSDRFGADSMELYNPFGIALDEKTNSLYIADGYNNRIQKYDMNKKNSSITVAGWGQLNNPYAVQLDPSGINMFISDTLNHRILVWLNGSMQGRVIVGNGTPGRSDIQLNQPTQIRFDSDYNLYVVDTNNCRVQRFDLISNGC